MRPFNVGYLSLPHLWNCSSDKEKSWLEKDGDICIDNEITDWIHYFVKTVLDAQIDAEQEIEFTLKKTKFFDNHKDALNERQQKVVRRMLEEGHQGYEGGMNARKYVSLTSASKATATRDLQDLVEKGIFKPIGGERSTSYMLDL
jgi:Fic family protein